MSNEACYNQISQLTSISQYTKYQVRSQSDNASLTNIQQLAKSKFYSIYFPQQNNIFPQHQNTNA